MAPTIGKSKHDTVELTPLCYMGLRIWKKILTANRGSSYKFILNKLPLATNDVFVDAATEWGIGGWCGDAYFFYPWDTLYRHFQVDYVARMELLVCVIALYAFGDLIQGRLVRLHTDNTNVTS